MKKKIIVHNPCNEYTQNYRYYNLFWEELTRELKNRYIVTENRYFEHAHEQRFEVNLKKGMSSNFLLLECEYVIEMEDSGEFYVLSISDTLTHAILNEQHNPFLKKVLVSQFQREEIKNHVHTDNLYKYSPWIYFPSKVGDLEIYFEKRKFIEEFQDKLFFRGSSLEDRPILNYFDNNTLQGILPTGGWEVYFDELINYKIGLSVAGRGQLCYRDIEYMAVGIPFIRFEYTSEMNPNLIPDYHYISVKRPADLPIDRLGNEVHANMITERFLQVKNDKNFLEFIAKNAREYYDMYLKQHNNVLHTLRLLDI